MIKYVESRPVIIEICPASTLKKQKLYFPYKGEGAGRERGRTRLLQESQTKYPLLIPLEIEKKIIADKNGDALDSLIAALAAYSNLEILLTPSETINLREGCVYI